MGEQATDNRQTLDRNQYRGPNNVDCGVMVAHKFVALVAGVQSSSVQPELKLVDFSIKPCIIAFYS